MLSKNLIILRKEKGFFQAELTDLISVSRQSLSKFETGLTKPNLENVRHLAKALNIYL